MNSKSNLTKAPYYNELTDYQQHCFNVCNPYIPTNMLIIFATQMFEHRSFNRDWLDLYYQAFYHRVPIDKGTKNERTARDEYAKQCLMKAYERYLERKGKK